MSYNQDKVTEIDDYIAKLERRIAKMKANPDPSRPKSNLYRYEITLDEAIKRRDAWANGKTFCDGGSPFMMAMLTNAMGYANTGFLESTFNTRNSEKYIALAAENGLPADSACDMSLLPLSMTEMGMIAPENCTLCDNHACTPMQLRTYYAAYKKGGEMYAFDIPLDMNYESIRYLTDQIEEFIELSEKHYPDIHYDEERLERDLQLQEEYEEISFKTYELLKNKPSPLNGLDILSFMASAGLGGDIDKRVTYAKMRYDELSEKVAKKEGPVPNEKARFLWTVTRPFFMDPFKVLADKGIAVPMYYAGGPLAHAIPVPGVKNFWGDRKLTPLEQVAAHAMLDRYGHYGNTWVDDMVWVCKDLGLDGVVNYAMVGCTATLGLKKMISDRINEECNIPVLHLDAREWDQNYASKEDITAQLEEFSDLVLARKGLL